MAKTVLILGTFDSKGPEYAFLRERILANGCQVIAANVGIFEAPVLFPIEISADQIAQAAGEDLASLVTQRDRGHAMRVMNAGVAKLIPELYAAGKFDGIIGMGGSGGTGIVTAAMRALPIGVPKICITTMAAGNVAEYVGTKDIIMMPSIVDVAGVNRISRIIMSRAAGAISGMVNAQLDEQKEERPLIAASMFGNTTACVDACRKLLDQQGYELLVFHATGTGGRVLESLAEEKLVDGVLDITTTEWADELCGGIFAAGPDRLSAAGRAGLPHLIVPGCIDMCNFGAKSTIPQKYHDAERLFYEWTPLMTLMRTTADENRQMGEIFARKANEAAGPVAFLFPLRGVSMLDGEGQLFCNWEADAAFFTAVKENVRADIPVVEIDCNINDPAFAEKAVEMFMQLISSSQKS